MKVLYVILSLLLFSCKSNENTEAVILNNRHFNLEDTVSVPKAWPWKGVVVSNHYAMDIEEDLTLLKENGANFITIYLKPRKIAAFENLSGEEALSFSLKRSDSILDKCKELGLYAMIYLSELPIEPKKGIEQWDSDFWNSKDLRNEALKNVKKVVDHFKNRGDELQAYQFFGEPFEQKFILGKYVGIKTPEHWDEMFNEFYTYIRENDKSRYILYTPGPGGRLDGYAELKPLNDTRIIYSFHYYTPLEYSHYTIRNHTTPYSYPGKIKATYWDKKKIKETLLPIVNFKERYNKPVYLGEFSVVYEAEGWEAYLNDILDIVEEHSFGYTYFGFNDYKAWAINSKNSSVLNTLNMGGFDTIARQKRFDLLSKHWKNKD